jgi:hypothetical protein
MITEEVRKFRGEEQFWFEGGSDADRLVRVEIQGAWLRIFRGIVRHPDKSEANPGTNISTSSKCPASVKANRTDLAPIYSQNSSQFSRWDRCREAHPSILCPGHFIAVENVFKRTGILGSASMPKQRDGHGWYCQQEGNQDGIRLGFSLFGVAWSLFNVLHAFAASWVGLLRERAWAVVPLDSTIYEPRIPTGAFASDCLLLALET